ncbi:MAG: hypothetical protein J7L08_01605 [Candidatus Aenigmarchaeota archaeon]|nr:hypothetical protein [Candidatus Aenigmarchaeota archaeon]
MAEKSIFLISPVRNVTDEEKKFIEGYITELKEKGYEVYNPINDTDQNDPYGLKICLENRKAIANADEIHIYWNPKSTGSIFDLGIVFGMNYTVEEKKKIHLINKDDFEIKPPKSFTNVVKLYDYFQEHI